MQESLSQDGEGRKGSGRSTKLLLGQGRLGQLRGLINTLSSYLLWKLPSNHALFVLGIVDSLPLSPSSYTFAQSYFPTLEIHTKLCELSEQQTYDHRWIANEISLLTNGRQDLPNEIFSSD